MALFSGLSMVLEYKTAVLWTAAAALVAYQVYKFVYNLFFHPLAKLPGPWWASLSLFHEFYYDIIKDGQYFKVIQWMHEKYGPIVRINPGELHINDPSWYDEVFASSGRRRDKAPENRGISSVPTSMVSTLDHDHHRERRAILQNFFSKQAITKLEDIIQDKVDRVVQRLKSGHDKGTVFEMYHVFAALTSDVISHYSYGESFGYLNDENFRGEIVEDAAGLLKRVHVGRLFPWLAGTLGLFPLWFVKALSPPLRNILDMQAYLIRLSKKYVRSPDSKSEEQITIFDALTAPEVPAHERHTARIADEALLVTLAGTETTSRALTTLLYHVLQNPRILEKLRTELKSMQPTSDTKVKWRDLEQLPYLTAVLNEGLRLSHLLIRSPRIAPDEVLVYQDWAIPPGTSLSMITELMCMHPGTYPDPHVFRPERWTEAAARGERLKQLTFSAGTRNCLGLNLAWAELYLTIAAVFRWFDFETLNADPETFKAYRDWGFGVRDDGYFGLRVKVERVLE